MTKLIAAILAAASVAILVSTPAEARRHSQDPFVSQFCGDRYCSMVVPSIPTYRTTHRLRPTAEPRWRVKSHREARTYRVTRVPLPVARKRALSASNETKIMPHPAGCPRTAFCGCGASLEVFGKSIRELWLAANWFKFPKAEPAPGRVAVRNHHVFVIRKVLGRGLVLAYDANSGRHLTRIHVRSLAGYSVRDPGGRRYASAAH